ncbi:DNA polymerase nu-like [Acipenser oxyrinchus oxyrinchus]|uniref:DNA polymerase nu-like n=1 Tax=Acipenser oxyrinchus oxyrinchus TaxID=40147 RepID=A0AAD8GJF8_ACIOX|nr:DNA polymerase nu-like [Acipenser oxyrinchus oxyrinchus]
MERRSRVGSDLYRGPLSGTAQKIMSAIRFQYSDRTASTREARQIQITSAVNHRPPEGSKSKNILGGKEESETKHRKRIISLQPGSSSICYEDNAMREQEVASSILEGKERSSLTLTMPDHKAFDLGSSKPRSISGVCIETHRDAEVAPCTSEAKEYFSLTSSTSREKTFDLSSRKRDSFLPIYLPAEAYWENKTQTFEKERKYSQFIVEEETPIESPRKQVVRLPQTDMLNIKEFILANDKVNNSSDKVHKENKLANGDIEKENSTIKEAVRTEEQLTPEKYAPFAVAEPERCTSECPEIQNRCREQTKRSERSRKPPGRGETRSSEETAASLKRKQSAANRKAKKAAVKWATPQTLGCVGQSAGDHQKNNDVARKPLLTVGSDTRICDAANLNAGERSRVLEEAAQAAAIVLTMVYQDGTSQLSKEQKPFPSVSGFLMLLKNRLDVTGTTGCSVDDFGTTGTDRKYIYLKLEQRPAWLQQGQDHRQFTREMLLQILGSKRPVICFKAKELLRTAMQHYRKEINWKQGNIDFVYFKLKAR